MVVSATSAIENESDYNPWGGELQLSNSDSNHYKFTGKERDGETGLDYFGARYYSNGLGRFLTPDWAAKAAAIPYAELADPQSLNLYSYVRNRLTVQIDPDGHYLLGANGEQMEAEYSENLANLDPSKDCKTCSKTPRHKKKKGPFKPKKKTSSRHDLQ